MRHSRGMPNSGNACCRQQYTASKLMIKFKKKKIQAIPSRFPADTHQTSQEKRNHMGHFGK
jgi:hypothetical protein